MYTRPTQRQSMDQNLNPWATLLQGSIWPEVFPYCLLNTSFMLAVELLHKEGICIAFNPAGHGLMTLIVSFLVINKVNLAYDRYTQSRHALGAALAACRELNQASLLFTENLLCERTDAIAAWRKETFVRTVLMMEAMIQVIQEPCQAKHLAGVPANHPWQLTDEGEMAIVDPLEHVQALRAHLFNVNQKLDDEQLKSQLPTTSGTNDQEDSDQPPDSLDLYERMKLMEPLGKFAEQYQLLLEFSSVSLPTQLVRMGRTFLYIWTFTIPLVMRGFVEEMYSAMVFVFFLTYGFVGLEMVSKKLMKPFASGEMNIKGMKEATILGMHKDTNRFSSSGDKGVIDKHRISTKLAEIMVDIGVSGSVAPQDPNCYYKPPPV